MLSLQVLVAFLLLECIYSQCSDYPLIANAKLFDGADYFIGSEQQIESNEFYTDAGQVLSLECKTGYTLVGDSTLTCSVDDSGNYMWIGKQYPQCVDSSWSEVTSEKSQIIPFNPQENMLQMRLKVPFIEFRSLNLKFWCNLNFYNNSKDTSAISKAYIRILYNFEESQIVDSILEFGTRNSLEDQRQCPFCLDFSAPNVKVPEVITLDLPHKTYYDGILGKSNCQKTVLDEWNTLMSGRNITGFSHKCSLHDADDENQTYSQETSKFWLRILSKNSSELVCNSPPMIENISIKSAKFPIQIGTVISVICGDDFVHTGSHTGTCMGFGNKYNFDSVPKCDKIVPSDGDESKDYEMRGQIDEVHNNKESMKAEITKKSEKQDNLPWNISLCLSLSFTLMAICCLALLAQLKTQTKSKNNKEY